MSSAEELSSLASTDVRTPLPKDLLLSALTSPPFIPIPGTFNTRDLGLVPSLSPMRPNFAYRSGALDKLLPEGALQLSSPPLNIKRVFDLRSEGERRAVPDPEVPGAENVWCATSEKEAKAELPDFVAGGGEEGYEKMYLDVLHVYKGPFRAVLEHVRDMPEEPFLFHCTAGRDRTGVLSGLLHALAGQPPSVSSLDFMLSRVGTEPAREYLLAFVMKGTGAAGVDEPGFYNLCSLRPSSWAAFEGGVERVYGGWAGYARAALGFSEEDLAVIRRNLSTDWDKKKP